MIKRIIEISSNPAQLSSKLDQLRISSEGTKQQTSIPCEDIGFVIIEHPQVTITSHALGKLSDFGAVVVVCGNDHLPKSILLPISGHQEVVTRLHDQMNVSKPLHKSLWKQLVVAKIRAQASGLAENDPTRQKLNHLARRVRSGDPTNVEAQAAKTYWAAWLDDSKFRRDAKGGGLNAMLNYGYTVIRAAIARSIVSSGLHPALGIHHTNRSNAFCLADDLLEPLRPLVDDQVRNLHRSGCNKIDHECKQALLGILHGTVRCENSIGPLMVALPRMTASYAHCLAGEAQKLVIPIRAAEAS